MTKKDDITLSWVHFELSRSRWFDGKTLPSPCSPPEFDSVGCDVCAVRTMRCGWVWFLNFFFKLWYPLLLAQYDPLDTSAIEAQRVRAAYQKKGSLQIYDGFDLKQDLTSRIYFINMLGYLGCVQQQRFVQHLVF